MDWPAAGELVPLLVHSAGTASTRAYFPSQAHSLYRMENNCLKIGTHMSVAGGYKKLAENAAAIGANTLQIFIRNPRGTAARELTPKEIGAFRHIMEEHQFGPFIAHAPYTLNLCSENGHLRELSGQMLGADLARMELFPGNLYNLHPGSRQKQSVGAAAGQIAAALNGAMWPEMSTTVLLETMAGKGSEMGRCFEELREILAAVELKEKIGVCMDACHMWDSGYDIVNHLDQVLEQFDRAIGLERLKAFHINDSMNPRGSGKDRHALLGNGCIGKEAVLAIVNHPRLHHLPFILETPTDLSGHAQEIADLKRAFRW